MPTVRYVGGNGYYIRDGPDFENDGDKAVVGERTADRLTSRDDFELVIETCDAVKSDGDVCGRDLPCPYHSED